MVSVSFNFRWATRDKATAPLNALETLAMRTVSSAERGVPVAVLPTPAVVTCAFCPTWTRAMAPGGPPVMETSRWSPLA